MNISNWIEFDITEKDREQAKEISVERRNYMRKRGYYPIFQTNELDNEINGLIGEIKFGEFMGLKPNLLTDDPGSLDFKINGRIVDVKTNENDRHPSRSPDNYKFLVNKAQANKHEDVDYYVSVMIYKNKGWICGLISREEVLTYSTDNPGRALCYCIPYSDLHKPQELRNLLSQRRLRWKDE